MLANDVCASLERDFIKPGITDSWHSRMTDLDRFLCANFKSRSMGLVCDFTETVNEVFTAVFPSEAVLTHVIERASDAMLFVHHPMIWDLAKAPGGFYPMNPALLDIMRQRRISIYNLHHPLDHFSAYSTSKTLADALGLEIVKPFARHEAALCGVIGKTSCETVGELRDRFVRAVGHGVKLYPYGNDRIANGLVAVCAGGGNQAHVLREVLEAGVNVLVTGLTIQNERSEGVHRLEEQNRISVLGGTHYSTEKFACMAMCDYFAKLGLPSAFVEEAPGLEDL